MRQMRVRHHGANAVSRWLYRRWWGWPLALAYYRLVRHLLTRYEVSEDGGRTWKWL